MKILPSITSKTLRTYAVVFVFASLSTLFFIVCAGCEGKAFDEQLGREVTASEAIAIAEKREAAAIREREKAEALLQAEKVQAAAAAKDAIRDAEAEATRKTEEIRLSQQQRAAEFRSKSQALELEYRFKLSDLNGLFEVSQAEALVAIRQAEGGFALAREKIGDEFEQRVSAADRRIAEARAAEAEKLEANEADTNAKLAEIQRENERMLGIANLVKSIPGVSAAAGSVGVDTNAVTSLLLGGALTGGVQSWSRRRKQEEQNKQAKNAEDAAWDAGFKAAQEQAEQARAREHAAWEESQRSLLLLHTQPPSNSRIGPNVTG